MMYVKHDSLSNTSGTNGRIDWIKCAWHKMAAD